MSCCVVNSRSPLFFEKRTVDTSAPIPGALILWISDVQPGQYRPLLGGGKVLRDDEINLGSMGACVYFGAIKV